MTLAGVAAQTHRDIRVIIADQSREPAGDEQVVQTAGRVIEARGGCIEWYDRRPVHGIAEQRDFLLKKATADAVLYLDDDVLMEPWVVEQLLDVLNAEQCGFVGAFPAGLSHLDDVRPEQQIIEYWDGPVSPEAVDPGSPQWARLQLLCAPNPYHLGQYIPADSPPPLCNGSLIASCIINV